MYRAAVLSVVMRDQPHQHLSFHRAEELRTAWINDQVKFFKRSAHKNERSEFLYDIAANGFFWLSGFIACGLAVHLWKFHEGSHEAGTKFHFDPTEHWLITGIALTLVVAALLHGYATKRAYSAQAKRYEWMKSLFGRVDHSLTLLLKDKVLKPEESVKFQLILLYAGKEALAENASWLRMHREHPLEVPKA